MHDSSSDIARRLFPAAYHQDEQHEQEYQRLMRDELLASRLQSMNTASEMLQRDPASKSIELTAAELEEFMRSINNLRLVIGTMLDIQESDDLYEDDEEEPGLDDERALALAAAPGVEIRVAGGALRLPDMDVVGEAAARFYSHFKTDFAVFGVGGQVALLLHAQLVAQ